MEKTNGVASIMGLAAQAGLSGLPNAGKITTGSGEISFSDALLKTSEVKAPVAATADIAKTKTTVANTSGNNIKNSKDVVKQQKNESLNEDGIQKVSDKVSEKASDIKEKIKSEFGKTDEEIEEAMEVLALSNQDLFNAADLRSLVMELTGITDSIELITNVELYDSIKDVTALADELITEIGEELSISNEEVVEIMNSESFEKVMSEVVSQTSEDVEDTVVSNDEDDTLKMVDTVEPSKATETVADKKTADEVKKPVEVTVEIDKNAEVRNDAQVTTNNASQNNASANGGNEKKQNLFSKDNGSEMIAQTQTVTTQTVNTVGDIVETVTSYTSYADTENIMRQVTDFVKVNISGDVTKMEMQLHPASLGTVNMQINSQNGQITAHLTVQNELVKSILESQMIRLQETFNEQGTKVTAIEVSVANYNLDAKSDNNYSQSGNEESKKGSSRRGINLNEIDSFDDLTDEEQLQAEVMEMNGGSVNYTA